MSPAALQALKRAEDALAELRAILLAEGALKPAAGQIDQVLLADLKRDEGLRLDAYADPLFGGDPWTIGYGHTGPEVSKGVRWTKEQAEAALVADVLKHNAELARHLPWIDRLDPVRRRVLQNMAFNLGVGVPGGTKGLLGFKNTLAMVERGDYAQAADAMLRSLCAPLARLAAKSSGPWGVPSSLQKPRPDIWPISVGGRRTKPW
jgi:lysozyme